MKKSLILLIFIFQISSAQSFKEEIAAFREKYKQDLLSEPRLPVKKEDIHFIQFFDADENYRVNASFNKTENAVAFDMPTMIGKTKKYIEYGKLTFMLTGKEYSLKIYQSIALLEKPEYKDYLFLLFNDMTNGNETYTNGRYLELSTSDIKEDKVLLDFNKAYNPYCAYSDGFNCPKPPEENNLIVEIRAGEKQFGKERH